MRSISIHTQPLVARSCMPCLTTSTPRTRPHPCSQHRCTAVNKDGDAPDRSLRSAARRQARRSSSNSSKPAPQVPGLLPTPSGPPSTEKEQAAMDQLVMRMSDEERVQMASAIEAQNDALLTERFTSMGPEEQEKLLESLRINKHYEQFHVWEEMLMQPIMCDMMRENIGPELSAIMDKLLGGPGWKDAHRPPHAPLPLSEVRKRLSLLTPQERTRVPELYAELEDWQRAYDRMGHIVAARQAAEDRASRIGRARLRRLARQKGLPDPTAPGGEAVQGMDGSGEDGGNGEEQDGEQDEEQDEEGAGNGQPGWARSLRDRISSNYSSSSSSSAGDGGSAAGWATPRAGSSSRGKKSSSRPSKRAARSAAKDALRSNGATSTSSNSSSDSSAAGGGRGLWNEAEAGVLVGGQPHGGDDGSGGNSEGGGPASPPVGLQQRLAHVQELLEQSGVRMGGAGGGRPVSSDDGSDGSVERSVDPLINGAEHSDGVGGDVSTAGGEEMRVNAMEGDKAGGRDKGQKQGKEGAVWEAAVAAGLSGELAEMVVRLERTIRRYDPDTGPGWAEDGHAGSPDMRCLQNIAATLSYASRLRDLGALEAEGLSVQELAGALEDAFGELQALMERWHRGFVQDGPTVSCLVFIETQLLQPSSDPDSAGSMELPVDPELMDELATFIRAAQSFEAVALFARSWEERHPHMPVATALERYGYVQGDEHLSELGAEEEFVGGYCVLWWAVRDQDEYGVGADAVRQPLVADWDKIDGLAAMDATMLRCCTELEDQEYSEEVLMKWSLHPVVGPRLRSGQPLLQQKDLPLGMQSAFAQAMGWRVEGLDYTVQILRASDTRAKPAAARLQRELCMLGGQLIGGLPGMAGATGLGEQHGGGQVEQQPQEEVEVEEEGGAGAKGPEKKVGLARACRLQRRQRGRKGCGFGAKSVRGRDSTTALQGTGLGPVLGAPVGGGGVEVEENDMASMGVLARTGAQGEEGSRDKEEAAEKEHFCRQQQEVQPPRDAAKAAAITQAKERGQALKQANGGGRGKGRRGT